MSMGLRNSSRMTPMGADKTKQLNVDEQDIHDEEQDAVVWPLSCPSVKSAVKFPVKGRLPHSGDRHEGNAKPQSANSPRPRLSYGIMTPMPDNRVCPRCGAAFHCGISTGACWCAALPPAAPVPKDEKEGCLCRACLSEELE